MNCPFNFEEEIKSQAGCLLLIELRGLKHFLLGLGKEDDRPSLGARFLSIISAGFPFTPPCLYFKLPLGFLIHNRQRLIFVGIQLLIDALQECPFARPRRNASFSVHHL
jgi:hypothetical protein